MLDLLRKLDQHGERVLLLILYCFIVLAIFIEVVRRFVLEPVPASLEGRHQTRA